MSRQDDNEETPQGSDDVVVNPQITDDVVVNPQITDDVVVNPQVTDAVVDSTSEAEEAEEDKDEAKESAGGSDPRGTAPAGTGGGKDEPEGPGPGEELYGLLAEFRSPGELIAAAEKVRNAGFTRWDSYSPFPVHGIDPAMSIKRTVLPWLIFVGGLCGLGGGLLLQWWTSTYNWPVVISGKPYFSIPANIPITFETTILASVLTAFFGMWALNRLPQVWHPFFKKDRFLKVTDDSFFIGVEAADDKFQRGDTEELLRRAGALVIEPVYSSAAPDRRRMPKALTAFIWVTAIMALVPLAWIAKARANHSTHPHYHIIPDMDFQPKLKAQRPSDLFWNGRASRGDVPNTVARGADNLEADDHYYRGIRNGEWASDFPSQLDISHPTIERGRQRFEIYCRPCHGSSGRGDGMVARRAMYVAQQGWVQPTSLHQANVVRQPHGQIFNTISNGIRTMPSYGAQIPEADRWAIVLYVRALQRSQAASLDDIPEEHRMDIR